MKCASHSGSRNSGDVKYAMRQLRGAPAFTAIAAMTLALGIGANSAMFALADTLLRPLPFATPDRLVMLWETRPRRLAASWRHSNSSSGTNGTARSGDGGHRVRRTHDDRRDGTAEQVPRADGHRSILRRARREADRRPDVRAADDRAERRRRRAQRRILAEPVRRRSGARRPRRSGSTDSRSPSSASCPRSFSFSRPSSRVDAAAIRRLMRGPRRPRRTTCR